MAILGIDEVGRGPWAGPLVVGACVLGDAQIEGLTDSKKLTPKKREALAPIIREKASCGLGWVSAQELDEIGLSAALCKACREAVSQIKTPFHEIIIDGTVNFLRGTKLEPYVQVLTKADLLVPEVSAASIVAKVARDQYMVELREKYPGYGFEKHVGYGTAAHKAAIEKLGVCDEHRKSFRPIHEAIENTAGRKAENAAADYLRTQGFAIVAQNWKQKRCEIDIVAEKDAKLYFCEVKYIRNEAQGAGVDRIGGKKLQQMRFAAEYYMATTKYTGDAQLAAIEVSGDNFLIRDFLVLE